MGLHDGRRVDQQHVVEILLPVLEVTSALQRFEWERSRSQPIPFGRLGQRLGNAVERRQDGQRLLGGGGKQQREEGLSLTDKERGKMPIEAIDPR